MKLSILVPVYNERTLVERSLDAVLKAPIPEELEREVVVVDDCSTDGTSAILDRIAAENRAIRLFRHEKNQGKGAAVRTAISHATGDFCLIQDADLEYDPNDYPKLLKPLLDGHADAVFGSRYLAGEQTRVLPFWHTVINQTLTQFCNMFCNLALTDMETCYKVFRTDLLKSIPIRSKRFGIEPEITLKCAKRKLRIYEVPISYHGRTYEEGKKIGWKDGVKALGAILYFWLVDDLYVAKYGRMHLNNLTGTPAYVSWIVNLIRPYVGDRVLELGAGIGTITGRLIGRRLCYAAAERDPLYLHMLKNRFLRTPNVTVRQLDPEREADYEGLEDSVDTVLCLNVLEYAARPGEIVSTAAGCLRPGGRLVLLAPQGPGIFGSVDETLGHRQRFTQAELLKFIESAGLDVESTHEVNKVSKPIWWFAGRVLRTPKLSKVTLKIFDKTTWLWRFFDHVLPWKGLSVVLVARRESA